MKTGLVWFRNDLRVRDNHSLSRATREYDKVIGVYCFDPRQFGTDVFGFAKTGDHRSRFLLDTVADLKASLHNLNISLLTFHEEPEIVLPAIASKHHVNSIYSQEEWTSEESAVSKAVCAHLDDSISWLTHYDQFLFHPQDIPLPVERIPRGFTSFRKKIEGRGSLRSEVLPTPMPEHNLLSEATTLPTLTDLGRNEPIVDKRTAFPFKGGESQGLERLDEYSWTSKKLSVYKKTRNGLLGKDYSSKFSPWLANGSLSPRTIYWTVKEYEKAHGKNDSTYWLIFELMWRDFFKYVSLKHGDKLFHLGGILDKDYADNNNPKLVEAWINGHTKEPFVNANMIELARTGWMSNRGRQNVASYFAKELNLDWRIGAAYFESMLLDYDVHSNYGNWMYVAGVGNDPRDRKFNVGLQASRYDADGRYQKRWLQTTLFE
jgi:deoxyribodipyrimidine photo-lyase